MSQGNLPAATSSTAPRPTTPRLPLSSPLPSPDAHSAWQDLALDVPAAQASGARILSLVECSLIELDHEPVAAQVSARDQWVVYFHSRYADSAFDTEFVRHRVTSHAGRTTDGIPRQTARDDLQTLLSRRDTAESAAYTVRPLETLL